MAGINCIDAPIGKAAPLMNSGLAFQNPVLPHIQGINLAISGLNLPQGSMACLAELGQFMSMFQDYTHFISGVSPAFPASALASPLLALPASATELLAGLTFVEIMGVLFSGLNVQKAMCTADASNPCALVSDVFGVVLGAAATVLSNTLNGLNAIDSLGMSVCEFIEKAIAALLGLIAKSIAAILAALLQALNYALGKLMQLMAKHPCFTQFIGAIATPALQSALQLPPLPIPSLPIPL